MTHLGRSRTSNRIELDGPRRAAVLVAMMLGDERAAAAALGLAWRTWKNRLTDLGLSDEVRRLARLGTERRAARLACARAFHAIDWTTTAQHVEAGGLPTLAALRDLRAGVDSRPNGTDYADALRLTLDLARLCRSYYEAEVLPRVKAPVSISVFQDSDEELVGLRAAGELAALLKRGTR